MLILACQRDDRDIACCEEILNISGHDIDFRAVPDAQSVLAWLTRTDLFQNPQLFPKPDLIITEFKTEKGDGLDIIRTVRKHEEYSNVPIIVYAEAEPEEFREAQKLGANVCLHHDAGPKHLCESMQTLLDL
jgi:CheY-like chemotaxis protein